MKRFSHGRFQGPRTIALSGTTLLACIVGAPALLAASSEAPFGKGLPLGSWRSQGVAVVAKPADSSGEMIASISGGGVTVGSNVAAGCALWSWKWGGREFLNQRDFGRLIQSSIATSSRYGFIPNPTEAGDKYSTPDLRANDRHGSPCILLSTITSPSKEFPSASVASPVQSTRAVPLEWSPENLSGGRSSAMVWNELVIGKDLTLNFNNMGPVAKYTTVVRVPRCEGQCGSFSAEIPTGYLTGDFNLQCVYDAKSHACRPVNLTPDGKPVGVFPPSGYGGVIFATTDRRFAMGIYGVSSQAGGSVTMPGGGISLYHFEGRDGASPRAASTYKWAAHGNSPFIAGEVQFNVYLVSGSLDGVQSLMNDLATAGVK